jgi:hypothetical protein
VAEHHGLLGPDARSKVEPAIGHSIEHGREVARP